MSYDIIASPKFVQDLRQIAADPSKAHLRKQVLKTLKDLESGASDGHHPLGYESGKGDLRDCVTAYVQSDPQQKADHRLVFRELGPATPGGNPRREMLAVRPRQGSGNIYEHTGARLKRHPHDRQPGLNAFGDRPAGSGGNQASRQAELDTTRAMAHAYPGQVPLSSSRPLSASSFGNRRPAAAARTADRGTETGKGT